ncbi:ATP-binding cassette domain-containing protein [Acinetobacter silvestris]|uniref:ABC transporter ATP-binding protein n=1 Tax=Acinetobacter silvestris TaxID=1977882 RepID=A0A1Y3CFW0_9GAMM|nr:ATP-binding cassette domain-containing protein [Acinetobacter silvestris]OTG65005.1 ABC transporter ATP-binding protein [Acinetobacter silvestris]
MTQPACVISKLDLEIGHSRIFHQLNFQLFYGQCSGLIGRNGQGKSLLLKILRKNSVDDADFYHGCHQSGKIHWQISHAYLPQLNRLNGLTIADALGVTERANSFHRIKQGHAELEDYERVENYWHLPQQWNQLLADAHLPIDLHFLSQNLSEGQKTKLALCRLFQMKDHYLLLDEPSNHLDLESRAWLIHQIQKHPAGCLIVSHDRDLLNQMQHIYALNEHGIQHFSGNYTLYENQKLLETEALQRTVNQENREFKQLKHQQQQTLIKAQKRQQTSQQLRKSQSQAKVLLDYNKEQAEQSRSSLTRQLDKQLDQAKNSLNEKQKLLEITKPQRLFLNYQHQKKSGELLRLTQIKWPYLHCQPIHFSMNYGDKLHLTGRNGIGKSTLLKAIQLQSRPVSGEIYVHAQSFYLDQNFSFLNTELNAVENLKNLSPHLTELECRTALGQLRLRLEKSIQPLKQLSGGERLKVALLAISQLSQQISLLLLDEPENHLDIESRALLVEAIKNYQGAVVLISHDPQFVQDCGIEQYYHLE